MLAGPNKNLDLALDVAYAIKTLIDPQLKLTGYTSYDDAVANWEGAAKAIRRSATDTQERRARRSCSSRRSSTPRTRPRPTTAPTVVSQVEAYAESVLTALGYGTFGRYDIEQRVGGNPSQNTGVDYVDPGLDGRAVAHRHGRRRGPPTGCSPSWPRGTRRERRPGGAGHVRRPPGRRPATSGPDAHHAHQADPLVLAQNETVFAQEYRANQKATADLVQLFTVAPPTYSAATGAPYGAGHCNFTPQSRVAVIDLLENWVQNGVYPAPAAIAAAMGSGSGYEPYTARVPGRQRTERRVRQRWGRRQAGRS